jgi:hypothetical protein
MLGRCELDGSGLGNETVMDSCENGNGPSGSMELVDHRN